MYSKKNFFTVLLIFVPLNIFSQKIQEYQQFFHEPIDIICNGVNFVHDIEDLAIVYGNHPNEDPWIDTLSSDRDYLLLIGKKYMIDSLCMINYYEYSMAFVYTGAYLIPYKKNNYLIITGYDGFLMGTMVQPLYLIFQIKEMGKEYYFLSSYYIENIDYYSEEILNSVKIVKKKDKIILKGINLKCVHGCN
jgi:hypothetical protein